MAEKISRPIKVMHIIARMNVGGPAVEITELMRGLDPNIISQRLVTGYCNGDEADFLETQAPDIFARRIDGLGRTVRPTDDAKALVSLTRMIRASRPDIVHTHTAKAGVLGRIAAKASGTDPKIIHTYHGHLLHGYFGPAKTKALVQLERRLARITHRIVVVGKRVREDLLAVGIGKSDQYDVIKSGVTLGPLPDKATALSELGLSGNAFIVSMIGRLTQIKRPDRFADVAELARDWDLDVRFLVAGGGDQEQYLRDRIEKSNLPVSMLGWRSDLERILAASDAVMLTSDNEGAPLSLIQAGLAGLPVIATRVGSVAEVVEHGVTGLLCEPEAGELAAALQVLITEPTSRMRLRSEVRNVIAKRYSVEAFRGSHYDTYERLVN